MLTFRGRLDIDSPILEVTWTDGRFVGNPRLIRRFEVEADLRDGDRVGFPEGPFTTTDHLSSDFSVIEIATVVFYLGEFEVTGDVPRRSHETGMH